MNFRVLAVLSISLLSAGCAIHPVPENVTGVDTEDIVRQIRCEARDALVDIIKLKLKELSEQGSATAQELLQEYERNPDAVEDFHWRLFPGQGYTQVQRFIKLFAEAAIAYSFDLQMTENNDLTTDINLVNPLAAPKLTLAINAGALRRRTNQRVFTSVDTFGFLVAQLNRRNAYNERYCNKRIVIKNYIYPIAGRVGVAKTIGTFINLTVVGALGGPATQQGKGPPTMVDKLTFTTTVNGSATPKVEFAPVGDRLQLANASLKASADRSDRHEVTIGLALEGIGLDELAAARRYAFSPSRGRGLLSSQERNGFYQGSRVSGGGTPAEQRAVKAIDEVKRGEVQLIPPPS
jgi:hypothetical protein